MSDLFVASNVAGRKNTKGSFGYMIPSRHKGGLPMTEETALALCWVGLILFAGAIWIGWGMAGMPIY